MPIGPFRSVNLGLASINNPNAGFAIRRSDDFLRARDINRLSNHFTGAVRPITSPGPSSGGGDPFSGYSIPSEFLQRTDHIARNIPTQTSNVPQGIYPVPRSPFGDFPEVGINPDASRILSVSTQYQAQLKTLGPNALPGFPNVQFGSKFPDAMGYFGHTHAFMNAVVAPQYGNTGTGVFYPDTYPPFSQFYPNPTLQPPYGATAQPMPYTPTPPMPYGTPYPAPAPVIPQGFDPTAGYPYAMPMAQTPAASFPPGYPNSYLAYPEIGPLFFPGRRPGLYRPVR